MIIYKVTNNVNGKIYIGQTIQGIVRRKAEHKCHANTHRSNSPFAKAIRKYGVEQFSWEVLHIATTLEELNEKEIFYIEHCNSTTKGHGYNVEEGGKQPITPLRGEDHPMYGKTHSEESKRKMSESGMGISRPKPEGFAEKLSKAKSQTWLVTTPEGEELTVVNLSKWCKERNVSRNAIKRPNGTYLEPHK
jgi:group I intron endonuclease